MTREVPISKYRLAVFDQKIIDAASLAKRLRRLKKISQGTIENWRYQGKGPEFVKIFGRVWYPIPAVEKWERENGF